MGDERRAAPRERWTAAAVAVLLVLVGIVVTPRASMAGPEIPGFMPAFGGAMIVIDLVLAVLLFSKGAIGQRAAPVSLGTAYLFSALIIVPHIAAFPGAIMPNGLIGTSASAVWLWSFWHTGFALAIIRHVIGRRSESRSGVIFGSVIGTGAAVVLLAVIATVGVPYLPSTLSGRSYLVSNFTLGMQLVVISTSVAALTFVLWRKRLRTAEDLWLTVAMLAACVDVWLTFQAGSRFTLGWYVGRAASLVTSLVVLVSLFRDITGLYSHVARANETLERLANVDGLTGLANRRQFDATLATEWRRAHRDGRPLSVVMLDVDHFKQFNDRYGHQEGDRCLRLIGQCLRGRAGRPGDLAARYGGEEFVMVLPSTDLAGATYLANEMRLAVRALAISHTTSPHAIVTISLGVATAVPQVGETADFLVAQADAALYRAKNAGRDQVCPRDTELDGSLDHQVEEDEHRLETV